ncbi:MAG TPA: YjbH domain-containing protein [Chlamydiales bacterium]|nr:YjbH domain-containing protein [Chlamydiales bacterium]
MHKFLLFFLPILLLGAENANFENPACQLFKDLKTVELIDQKLKDSLPLMINYQLQGGYFTMPSARTYKAGILGFGYSYVAPYNIWSLAFNFFDHIETTGNYWIYRKLLDGSFGHLGFGDYAERAANIKFVLLKRTDGFPLLPCFAIGWNDFFGSQRFRSFYMAATKEFLDANLEATLGWGNGRIQGCFGGIAWTPWRHSSHFLKDLTFAAEYDANHYRHHWSEHPKGREVKSRVNAGFQLKLWDLIRLSGSTLRGTDWAASLCLNYDIGSSSGLFPKIFDTDIYTAPRNTEPLGLLRTRQELAQEFAFTFKEQGFDLYDLYFIPGSKDSLWMKVVNVRYREEEEVRRRIEYILASITPSNISNLTVVIEADGVAGHEYRFRLQDLKRYSDGKMGDGEFAVLSPLQETSSTPSTFDTALLYKRRKRIWMLTFRPWTRTFFGSSRGKFKYEAGFCLGSEGYLFNQIYYSIYGSYTALASTQDLQSVDFLNPSRMINVRTDSMLYNQSSSFHLDQTFLQKSVNWGTGWFSRFSLGYFETAYAGVGLENLYFPVNVNWAIGFDAATLLKREYYGMGFQRKIRKITQKGLKHFPFIGLQYFVDFYYQYLPFNMDFKISAGQFLARDKGIRLEGGRTFQSGLRVGLWCTFTNANDVVNGDRYYDKGFSITLPLDIFMNQTSRTRVGYSMSAWLRDCGGRAATGKALYPTLYWERYNYAH